MLFVQRMAEQSPRTSDRSNKGVPPKRFVDMEKNSAAAVVTGSQQLSTNAQPGGSKTQPQPPQVNILRLVADMQKEMMTQIGAVHTNLQSLIVAQTEETATNIATLKQQIQLVSQSVDRNGQSNSTRDIGLEGQRNGPSTSNGVHSGHLENNGESFTNYSSHSQGSASVKAKKIYPLPKFHGLPEEWPTFKEEFEQTTEEFEYSPLQNIIRIREALHGPAKETVESLLSSSKNVNVILEILRETYGRPEQLIKSQLLKINALLSVPEGRLDLLIEFAIKVTNMTRFLQTASGTYHLNNPTLLSELISKLPPTKQMQWAEKCIVLDQPPNLKHFSEWLDGVRKVANMVSDGLPASSSSSVKKASKNKYALTTSFVYGRLWKLQFTYRLSSIQEYFC